MANFADDETEVGKVCGALSLAIIELDLLRNIPNMNCETKVSDSGRIRDWKDANINNGPIVLELR